MEILAERRGASLRQMLSYVCAALVIALAVVLSLGGVARADVVKEFKDNELRTNYVNSYNVLDTGYYQLTGTGYDDDYGDKSTIYINGNVTIDLNGHTYYYKGSGPMFQVNSGGSLTITDTAGATETTPPQSGSDSVTGNLATLTSSEDGSQPQSLTYYVTTSTVNADGTGTTEELVQHNVSFVESGNAVGAISAQNGAASIVKVSSGGTFELAGGLLYVNPQKTNPSSSYYSNYYGDARAVYVNGGSFTMSGGYIAGIDATNNNCTYGPGNWGGGVYIDNNGSMSMTGGVIAGNKATSGGGICANGTGTSVNISGGVISGNSTNETTYTWENNYGKGYGAGIYGVGADITVSGGYITNNKVLAICYSGTYPENPDDTGNLGSGILGGGGIAALGDSNSNGQGSLTISGGYVTGNYARNAGGGIYAGFWNRKLSSFSITGGTVASNVAQDSEGGGIRIAGGDGTGGGTTGTEATINVESGTAYITNNTTNSSYDWGGGGVFVQTGGLLTVKNSLITNNTADGYGGGVGACPTGETVISSTNGTAIYGNTDSGTGEANVSAGGGGKNEDSDPNYVTDTFKNNGHADIFLVAEHPRTDEDYIIGVTGRMLGNGAANWQGTVDHEVVSVQPNGFVAATYMMGLTASPNNDAKTAAQTAATVVISGNQSHNHGGGIMTNGGLILGDSTEIKAYLSIKATATKTLERLTSAAGAETEEYELSEGMFSYVLLSPDEGTTGAPTWNADGSLDTTGFSVLQTVTNDADGNIIFDAESLGDVGTHTLYVAETYDNSKTGVNTWDQTIYKVVATVEIDKQTTILGISYTTYKITSLEVTPIVAGVEGETQNLEVTPAPDGTVTVSLVPSADATSSFTNVLEAPVAEGSVVLTATKTLEGATLEAGEFSFELLDAEGTVLETATNAADGTVSFDALTYDADDVEPEGTATFTYTLREVVPSARDDAYDAHVTYDTHECAVTVVLTRSANSYDASTGITSSTIEATASYAYANAADDPGDGTAANAFVNTWSESSRTIIKTIIRRILPSTGDPTSWIPLGVLTLGGASLITVSVRRRRSNSK